MSINVQEIYQQTVLLPVRERLELIALVINDLRQPPKVEPKPKGKKLSDLFGAASLGYATGLENEQIDADLARAYADTHEDGS